MTCSASECEPSTASGRKQQTQKSPAIARGAFGFTPMGYRRPGADDLAVELGNQRHDQQRDDADGPEQEFAEEAHEVGVGPKVAEGK